jgi:uncharacterized protein YfaS (alpha-2-macroglobulin family)
MERKQRNLIIVGVLLAVMAVAAGAGIALSHRHTARPSIGVFDVQVDKQRRAWADIVFDKPVEIATAGSIIDPPPATISPSINGTWRWHAQNVLRFEPAGGFSIGTTYTISLKTQRFITADERFRGSGDLTVMIDAVTVEKVVTTEVPQSDRKSVVINGEITFNYPVDVATVITHLTFVDGDKRQSVDVIAYTDNDRVITFRTWPVAKSQQERTAKLIIARGLPESTHGAKLENDYVAEVKIGSSKHLAVRATEPASGEKESSLRVGLSSAVNADVASKFITIKPPAKFRVTAQGNDLFFNGGFTPGATYQLAIGKGMPGVDESVLDENYAASVKFPDLSPKLDFQSEGMFLSATGYKTLAIESTNVPDALIAVDRIYRNNIFYMLSNEYWSDRGNYSYEDNGDEEGGDSSGEREIRVGEVTHTLGDAIARKKLKLRNVHNKNSLTTISLEPYVNAEEPGLYRVVLAGHPPLADQTRWILITDLGIVAKRGADDLLVWVSSFKDLGAIDGANVTLVSDQNQVLATGRTDSRGLWRMHDMAKLTKAKKQPFMLTVQRGNDYSFLIFGRTEVDLSPFDIAGDKVPKDGYSAFVYGERDIYRPGETLEGVAVVRTRALEAPPQMPLVVKHFDANNERESIRINAGDGGVASFKLALPAYARTGRHRLDVIAGKDVIGTYNFQVEEFVPDRVKVEVKPKKPYAAPGDDLVYDVRSAYLFGPPAANLAVDTRVRLVSSSFRPPGFESFTFGNSERKFDPREIESENGSLDAAGLKEFRVAVPPGLQPPGALEAIIASRVQEQGGRGVAAVAHVPVHPWPVYIGLRRAGDPDVYPDPGKPVQFEWVTVGIDGKETKNGGLRAELFDDEWHTLLRRTASGYAYESTKDSVLLTTHPIVGGSSRGTFTFMPSAYRTFRVVVSDASTGASTAVEFCAGGWGYSPWAMKNPGRVQLDLDKDEYAPGDTATLAIKSPFAGKLLVTVERDDINYTTIETLTGNSGKITIPLTAELRPNAYVTATVVRAAKDLEPGEAGRAFGAIPINVDREANRIRPSITIPPDMRSNRALPVEVSTEPGATVTIAAVDEGILQLIAQKTPDPHAYFYRKLALGVSTADIFAELLPEVKPRGGATAGGGENLEGLAQYVRADSIRRAKPIAFWSGALKADASGKVRTKFDISDFQGGVRVMAVAHHGRHFGSSEAMTRVHDPIVLMPTFPRFLSVRDQVSIPVGVRNDTGRAGRFTIRAEGSLDSLRSLGMTQTLDLPNASEKTLFFTLKAPQQPGDVAIDITANGNGQSAKASAHVGVRWDLPVESIEDSGRFNEPSALFRNGALDQFQPGSVERTLVISPLPLVQFRGKLIYLLHYPYGCVEQTTSSVFPLIYFGDLAQELDPEAFAKNDSAAMVAAGIKRLATMQTYNGSFSMWPYGTTTHEWGTIYATHFLVEAHRAGHDVPQPMLDRALAYLGTSTKPKDNFDSLELEPVVYSLYVLARAGKADIGTMDYIREHHLARLNPHSRVMLAAAYASTGNPKVLEVIAAGVRDIDDVARNTGGCFDSAIRNRAMMLLALLDAAPNDPRIANLVERLTRDISDRYWSTQESAFALIALGQLAHAQHQAGTYRGTVFVDGKSIGDFTGKTAVFRHIRGRNVEVRMLGAYNKGAAYYSMTTSGVRTAAAFKPESAGITVKREFFTRDGKVVDPNDIRQGDLLVCAVHVQSTNGAMSNVVVQNLIPSGLEVENPRLKSSESFTWITGEMSEWTNVDIRDDQVIDFIELPASGTPTYYTLLRAVTPGVYQQPPVFAEAMYARMNHAVGERGVITVKQR